MNKVRSIHIVHIFHIIIILGLMASSALAADTLRLNLDDCLKLAFAQGASAQISHYDSLAAEANYKAEFGRLLPQIALSCDVPNWWKAIDERIIFDPQTERQILSQIPIGEQRWQSSLSIGQRLPWGAQLNLSSRLYRRHYFWDQPGDEIRIDDYSLRNRSEIEHPLLAGNPVGRQRKLAVIGRQTALIDAELRRREIRYRITSTFFGLVSAWEEMWIAVQDLESGRASADLASRKLKAGLIPEVELLQIQVDVARREAALRSAEDAVKAAEDNLKIELGLPLDERVIGPTYSTDDTLIVLTPAVPPTEQRLEVLRARLTSERSEINARAAIWQARIQASLLLYYETDARRRTFDSLGMPASRNLGVTLSFALPVFGFGSTSGKVEAARAELRSAQIAELQSNAQIAAGQREALRRLERAKIRFQIAASALELSIRSYDITNSRFASGLVSSRDLLDAQLDLTRTRKELLAARIECELAIANIEKMQGES